VLGGGLGNQMFQYAFARTLQEQYHDDKMKIAAFRLKEEGIGAESLWCLNIRPETELLGEQQEREIEKYTKRYLDRIRYVKKLSGKTSELADSYIRHLAKKGIFTSREVYAVQQYSACRKEEKIVFGGFQTWRYWQHMIPEIRTELKVKTQPSAENKAVMEEMQACESVCVHIRRGDYLAPQYRHLNVCDEAYYRQAMAYVQEQKPDAVFYIFTNNHSEIEWIRENYDFSGYSVRYVDLDNPDYEELRLMYHCKNFIISNSTFSWWGQMLSDAPDKIVVAPGIWNRQMPADGIYMPSWHTIENF
jgi:hypothetical protein